MMIKSEDHGACRILRLARPEKANALTAAMLRDLCHAITSAGDAGAKVLILTGEGRVFSAGADLEEMATGLGSDPIWEKVTQALASFPGLTIAALNGTLAGGV
jgi:enoyl-CoA hydratase